MSRAQHARAAWGAWSAWGSMAFAAALLVAPAQGIPPEISAEDAQLIYTGEHAGDGFGNAVAGIGNIDDAPDDEAAIGSRALDGADSRIYVLNHTVGTPFHYVVDSGSIGHQGLLGPAVAGGHDVNGDGYDDFVVGDPGAGVVRVHSGDGGAVLSTITAEVASDQFGHGVALGHFNDDDLADVLVGAPSSIVGGGYVNQGAGRAYVFYAPLPVEIGAAGADVIVTGTANGLFGERLGYDVSTAGDFDQNGYEDLLIAAPYGQVDGGSAGGNSYVFLMPPSCAIPTECVPADADVLLQGEPQPSAFFGYALHGGGDFNADGYADVAVGAYLFDGEDDPKTEHDDGTDNGRVYVYFGCAVAGPQVIPALEANIIIGGQENPSLLPPEGTRLSFGNDLAFAGDVDGDGYDDLVVGAPYYDDNHDRIDGGAAYLFRGFETISECGEDVQLVLSSEDADLKFLGQEAGDHFGFGVGGAGHIIDGVRNDVIVGAPGHDQLGDPVLFDVGRAYVFHVDDSNACTADIDGNGAVDVGDLVDIILDWDCTDPPGPCPGDVNQDGEVNVGDLVFLILSWGPCGE